MKTQISLADIVGPTPEVIAQAEARRALLWPLLEARANVEMTKLGVSRKVLLGKRDENLLRGLRHLAQANHAKFWINTQETARPEYILYLLEIAATHPSGRIASNFYSEENLAKRDVQAKSAAATSKFLGLSTLKGSEKQTAWAESIRNQFRLYCEEDGQTDAFIKIASSKEAASAKFWINNRDRLAFEHMLDEAKNAAS